jgi:hypothetical protein
MLMEPSLLSILTITRNQPTAYLGCTENRYSALTGLIIGFAWGARYAVGDLAKEIFPRGFDAFVKSTLNKTHGESIYGSEDYWIDVILSEAGSQDAAFKLFFELLDDFLEKEGVS